MGLQAVTFFAYFLLGVLRLLLLPFRYLWKAVGLRSNRVPLRRIRLNHLLDISSLVSFG